MPDQPSAHRSAREVQTPRSWIRRVRFYGLMLLYCVAIYAALDLTYSHLLYERDRSGRIQSDHYHHGFRANFQGYESWGPLRAKIHTNSLGFKDETTRNVPAAIDGRRIVLIGDSFTEGVGLRFEDTFAGMLQRAGHAREPKTEFLNAAVVSYSPTVYYKKIKYLIEAGLQFNEVVVFSDLSDVQDEAKAYFCFDDDPAYRRHCVSPPPPPSAPPSLTPQPGRGIRLNPSRLLDHFVITKRLLNLALTDKAAISASIEARAGWSLVRNSEMDRHYQPLGIEGGIKRSLANMQRLADLLRSRGIGLTVVVYPWPVSLAHDDRRSAQVEIWREFCAWNCKAFVDLFPAMFAIKDAHSDWYQQLFIAGDFHYSAQGNQVLFRLLAERLL